MQLCNEKKVLKPWSKVIDKKTKTFNFVLTGNVKNYLGFAEKQKYNFYLGGTDSCQGDF